MTPAHEKKILTEIVERLDGKRTGLFDHRRALTVLWALCCAAFFLVFLLGGTWGHVGVAFAFTILGAAIGIGVIAREGVAREPIVARHVDRASVERRLAELGA